MELLIAFCLGITLSAASGFRLFVPPLIMSIYALHGNIELAPEFEWVGTHTAMIVLAVATVVEILAYYIPVVDNFLDTLEIPTALVIGTLLTSASLGGDIDPVLRWTIAVIAGGGSAEIVQGFTSVTRLASTGLTAGVGNSLFSTSEALSATVLSILAVFVPVLSAMLVVVVLVLAIKKLWKFFHRKSKDRDKSYHNI